MAQNRIMDMKQFQIMNHFPGMSEICRKDSLARNMNRLFKLFPEEYNIFPRTWSLPADYKDFQAYSRRRKGETYICKPGKGCQGQGIFLTYNADDIKPGKHMICQQYLEKPFLIDGFKFDLRLYVLVTSCDPLRIFIYNEGIVRFATTSYTKPNCKNLNNICMHLTNYSINKLSENFIRDDIKGSKRKLSTLRGWLENHGYDAVKLWSEIDDVIIKTLISIQPILKHRNQTCFPFKAAGTNCFTILGFDIILDQELKPWLLEVNHSPSFTTDSRLDQEVKDAVLQDTLNMIRLRACDTRKVIKEERRVEDHLIQSKLSMEARLQEQLNTQTAWLEQVEKYEDSHLGGYRRIYPSHKPGQYGKFFIPRGLLYMQTATSKARAECVRKQMEELRLIEEPKPKKSVNNDAVRESAAEKPATYHVPKRPTCPPPPNYIRSMERKLRFIRPPVLCQETETVTVLPLPNLRSRHTASFPRAHTAPSHHSNRDVSQLPRLFQPGRAAPPSSQYPAGRKILQRVVQNIRATAAVSEPVKQPARDSQRSLSGARTKAAQNPTCKKASGVSSGSLKNIVPGGRRPEEPRSGFLPVIPGNRSLVAAPSSAPVTRRTRH
ncbi:tubulin polyglutamylase ttll6-like [Spea bombifrons]|uniref:tubulin polyglutamylase ttll6-like n=1 Tax=Spea bombifrons TaxID=233779 RepID=UPI00234B3805|nr:tubulin polyglutamylase ttll6-like [Spea bombifrons]